MHQDVFEWTGKIRRHLTVVLARELDMGDVCGTDAAKAVEEFAEIERLAAVAKVRAARRVAETEAYRRAGDNDAAGWLARTTGSSKRDAERSLAAATALDDLDATREAAERGELSEQQLREITDAATANPDAEADLLDAARTESMAGLKDRALKAKASAGDRATRHERVRLSRRLRHGVDAEGAFWLQFRHTADVGARMLAALRPYEDAVFARNRGRGVRETREAYAADALAEALGVTGDDPACPGGDDPAAEAAANGTAANPTAAATDPASVTARRRGRPNVKVIVRVDLPALRRGHTEPGELAEIAGIGPVPVSTIRHMLDDAFLAAVLTDGIDVRTVTHLGRRPNAFQQTVLELTHSRCDVEGCSREMFLEADHRVDWSTVKVTDLTNIDKLCEHHHDLKTNQGWRLVAGTGKRPFVPPDHPDHPANAPPTADSAPPAQRRPGPTIRRRQPFTTAAASRAP